MKRSPLPLNLFVFLLVLIGCKNDEDPKIAPNPGFSVSKKFISLTHKESGSFFYVKNEGNTEISWVIETPSQFLKSDPFTGRLATGDSARIDIVVDKSKLSEQLYEGFLVVKSDSLPFQSVHVRGVKYEEKKWLLNDALVDAEYDKVNNVILALSANAQKLLKINPETKEIKELDIRIKGNCISISKDGKYAAIGHNYSMSYVNIETMQIEKSMGLLFIVRDIVLAPNGWIYLFPNDYNWTNLVSLKVGTWEEKSSFYSVHGGVVAKLHPSGSYIYSADINSMPSDFEKYDITNGAAGLLYDSPYHGEYAFSGNIWISEDGKYLFAASGNIFTSSTTKEEDIKFLKKLPGDGVVLSLDHSFTTGRIFAAFQDFSNFTTNHVVRKFDESFNLLDSYSIPGFLFNMEPGYEILNPSKPELGFFNASGSKYYLLVSPESNYSSSSKHWALVTYPVN